MQATQQIDGFVAFLRQFQERLEKLEKMADRFSAPSAQEQSERAADFSEQKVSEAQEFTKQESPAPSQEPIARTTTEPTVKDREALLLRASKLLANGGMPVEEYRTKVNAHELVKPSAISSWEDYDTLDSFFKSKGF